MLDTCRKPTVLTFLTQRYILETQASSPAFVRGSAAANGYPTCRYPGFVGVDSTSLNGLYQQESADNDYLSITLSSERLEWN